MKKVRIIKEGRFNGIPYKKGEILELLKLNPLWCSAKNNKGQIVHLYYKGAGVSSNMEECEIFEEYQKSNFYII